MRVGTAGWAIGRDASSTFPDVGSHLERYAAVLSAVEINSSFYRSHQPKTYARWAASTPDHFRFAVKLPRAITHDQRLVDVEPLLDRFLTETAALGDKRGPILIQFPPSFVFDDDVVASFFDRFREKYEGHAVCEPRHPSWSSDAATSMLVRYRVARVAADPPRVPGFDVPGGWDGLVYIRLHGSPRTYWSRYDERYLADLSRLLVGSTVPAWCIFDNTAAGAALVNARELLALLAVRERPLNAMPDDAASPWGAE